MIYEIHPQLLEWYSSVIGQLPDRAHDEMQRKMTKVLTRLGKDLQQGRNRNLIVEAVLVILQEHMQVLNRRR